LSLTLRVKVGVRGQGSLAGGGRRFDAVLCFVQTAVVVVVVAHWKQQIMGSISSQQTFSCESKKGKEI
jgi:hypothetical protein